MIRSLNLFELLKPDFSSREVPIRRPKLPNAEIWVTPSRDSRAASNQDPAMPIAK
jgi:hypothetical protein